MKGNMSQAFKKTDHSVLSNRDKENQHPISAIDGLKEELDSKVPTQRTINGYTLDNDVHIDNVASADTLKTARTISLSGAVKSTPISFNGSKDISIPVTEINESYLEWSAEQANSALSPIDIALLPELYLSYFLKLIYKNLYHERLVLLKCLT